MRRVVPKEARESTARQEHSIHREKRRMDLEERKGSVEVEEGEEEGVVERSEFMRENKTVPR
jgi:hypothetical protein